MFLGIDYRVWLAVVSLIVAILILIKVRYNYKRLPENDTSFILPFGFVTIGTLCAVISFVGVVYLDKSEQAEEVFWPLYLWWTMCLVAGIVSLLIMNFRLKRITEDYPYKAENSLKELRKQIKKQIKKSRPG